jgi:biopolymer transport protein ExbD
MLPQHYSRSVDLASADHPELQPDAIRDSALKVYVTRDGSFYFRYNKVAIDELPDLLRTACLKGSERKVYLRVDARARYADVKVVLDQISTAGIHDVAFIVEGPPKPTP